MLSLKAECLHKKTSQAPTFSQRSKSIPGLQPAPCYCTWQGTDRAHEESVKRQDKMRQLVSHLLKQGFGIQNGLAGVARTKQMPCRSVRRAPTWPASSGYRGTGAQETAAKGMWLFIHREIFFKGILPPEWTWC